MSTPRWPHDHKAKHAAAARKGWVKRGGGSLDALGHAQASVRQHTYHGKSGYLVSGTGSSSRGYSIFSRTKSEATRMRNEIRRGAEPTFNAYRKKK